MKMYIFIQLRTRISATDLRPCLAEALRAVESGESVVITRHARVTVGLVFADPLERLKPPADDGVAAGDAEPEAVRRRRLTLPACVAATGSSPEAAARVSRGPGADLRPLCMRSSPGRLTALLEPGGPGHAGLVPDAESRSMPGPRQPASRARLKPDPAEGESRFETAGGKAALQAGGMSPRHGD